MGLMAQNWRAAAPVQRMGVTLLLLGPPLLLWQAFPANQIPISQPAFLAVHSIMEIFAVVVAALIFFTAYGTPRAERSVRVVVLGCAFLAAALFDGLHLLSYEGMPALVTDNSPHKSILFWLCARFSAGFSAGFGHLLYVLLPDTRPAGAGERQWMLMATLALTTVLS
jgi:diguanylate cyclase